MAGPRLPNRVQQQVLAPSARYPCAVLLPPRRRNTAATVPPVSSHMCPRDHHRVTSTPPRPNRYTKSLYAVAAAAHTACWWHVPAPTHLLAYTLPSTSTRNLCGALSDGLTGWCERWVPTFVRFRRGFSARGGGRGPSIDSHSTRRKFGLGTAATSIINTVSGKRSTVFTIKCVRVRGRGTRGRCVNGQK